MKFCFAIGSFRDPYTRLFIIHIEVASIIPGRTEAIPKKQTNKQTNKDDYNNFSPHGLRFAVRGMILCRIPVPPKQMESIKIFGWQYI